MATPSIMVQTFVTGATNATQQTALSSFQTALTATQALANGGNVAIVFAGQEVTPVGSTPAPTYTFWAIVQYMTIPVYP